MANYVKTINNYPIMADNMAFFGYCSTGSSTSAKVVTCANFQTLVTNAVITVRFASANMSSGALTLNVNSTGAQPIVVGGSDTSSTNQLLWDTGAIVTFMYNGSGWVVVGEPRCWYGTCSTAAGTTGKTTAVDGSVVICKGTRVTLGMTYNNTATSATLNVNSTGAKNLYYGTTGNAPVGDTSWAANTLVPFVFDGQYWRMEG